MFRVLSAAVAVCACALSQPLSAQTVLTLDEVVARARTGGAVSVAEARIAEADANRIDAAARFRDNPLIEASVGPRSGAGERSTDIEVAVSQLFETGGQRRARVAAAQAGVDRRRAEVGQAVNEAVFEAATHFLRGLAAGERLRIAEETYGVGQELLAATERRYNAGDVTALDLNLVRIDAARVAAMRRSARADLTEIEGQLRALLRLPPTEPLQFSGSLDLPAPKPLQTLSLAVTQKPEFVALEADARDSDAQVRLGRALTKPDLGFRLGYGREQSDTILLGGLTIGVPAFQRGQGTLAGGLARASRARLELDLSRTRALTELMAAYAAYEQRAQLSSELARDSLPSVADNETLARRSYDAGEMNLMDLLLVRRDALVTRTELIERRLDAALSRLKVDFTAGVLP